MRCEDAREALAELRNPRERGPELAAHLAECRGCAAFEAQQTGLDRLLALDEPALPGPGFDTRFFARLAQERARPRRRVPRALFWAAPLAAAAALLLVLRAAPHAPVLLHEDSVPTEDLPLAMELDLVEDLEVVKHLDEVQDYEVLSQISDAELERIAKEGK